MQRIKIIAGNWKMNLSPSEAYTLGAGIRSAVTEIPVQSEIWLAPPFIYIDALVKLCTGSLIRVGAQDCSAHEAGAFTGEVSATMLKHSGAFFTIVGHSERRQYHGETDSMIAKKIQAALQHGLTPVYCCGETLEQRNAGMHTEIVAAQVREALQGVPADQRSSIVIAYEPVWAIGTGVTATPVQAQEMHAWIRSVVAGIWDEKTAAQTRLLYGGSVKPSNAAELFAMHDIDGGLIGGASLLLEDFTAIIRAAEQ